MSGWSSGTRWSPAASGAWFDRLTILSEVEGSRRIAQRRREFFGIARGFFEKAARAFPENKIVRMYLGHPTSSYKHYEAVSGAPQWAVYQREGLEHLADIIEWWIDNRMQENGEYGGGWGDDCEMWRWWVPVLIGFDSPKITKAQARFSKKVYEKFNHPGFNL